jgi:hypothetical protein
MLVQHVSDKRTAAPTPPSAISDRIALLTSASGSDLALLLGIGTRPVPSFLLPATMSAFNTRSYARERAGHRNSAR